MTAANSSPAGHTVRDHRRSMRWTMIAADSIRNDEAVCGLGRPGQDDCSCRTASANNASSRPNDEPVAYSARKTMLRAATVAAGQDTPARAAVDDARPDCARSAAADTASRTAVQGVIWGHGIDTSESLPTGGPADQVHRHDGENDRDLAANHPRQHEFHGRGLGSSRRQLRHRPLSSIAWAESYPNRPSVG